MNKLALVTGASNGIGLEFAKILGGQKYNLILVARDKEKLQKVVSTLAREYGVSATAVTSDLSKSDSVDKIWKDLPSTPDVVFNNAGFGDYALVVDAAPDTVSSMIDMNVKAMTRLAQLAAIDMKKRGSGHIVNTASTAAFLPGPGMAVYYATKAFVLSYSEALSEELKNSGVRVMALCPGPTETGFQKSAHAEKNAVFNRKLPAPAEVAQFAYKSMLKNKVVAVHGFSNKLSVFLPRMLPRSAVRRFVSKAQLK